MNIATEIYKRANPNGIALIAEGQEVTFDIVQGPKGPQAANVASGVS